MTRAALFPLALLTLLACGDKEEPYVDPEVVVDDTGEEVTDDTGEVVESDAGDTIEEAQAAEFGGEEAMQIPGTISPAGDRDFYEIQATAGDHIELYTASYALLGEVVLDTVLRVYDESGQQIDENDDMPFRWQETDSAVTFQAPYTGSYFVEVLEWGDWADAGASGGATYEYILVGFTIDSLETVANDTQAEADAWAEGGAYRYYGNPHDEYASRFYGDFVGDSNGIDVWPQEFSETDGTHYTWSIYPGYHGNADLKMSLYNESWELLASTTDTEVTTSYIVVYDVGIMYPVTDGTYYLAVENQSGSTDAGDYYGGITTGYTNALTDVEVEPNDSLGQGTTMEWTESSNTAGYFFARGSGSLPTLDDTDRWRIGSSDTDGLNGKYLNVEVMAERAGSLLDAEVKVFDADGNELASQIGDSVSGSNDPNLMDLVLPSTGSVSIEVTPVDLDDSEAANYYYVIMTVSDEAVN